MPVRKMRYRGKRERGLLAGIFLVWTVLFGKLTAVQIVKWRYYQNEAKRLHFKRVELLGERGRIYDRKGRALALNRLCCSIQILPNYVRDKDTLAEILAGFGLGSVAENRALLSQEKRFFWFRRFVDFEVGDSLRKVLTRRRFINAVLVQDAYQRIYPFGEVCADVVGFVGTERGLAGIEWEFDSVLRGAPGWIMLQKDALGWTHPSPNLPMKKPVPGADIYLTIDAEVQQICFEALRRGVEESGAKRGSVIVLDAQSGAILAGVDFPGYEPARFANFPPERYKWDAVADQFEPGSSFKIVICAAALEDSAPARFTERVYDVSAGFIQIGSKKIKDVHPNGVLSFDSVFIQSSNPACALMSFEVNPEVYYAVARKLGFAEKVGIDFPNEGSGRLDRPPQLRNRLRFATISFGQGVMVTLLQMAAAYLCVANGGKYLKPYLLAGIVERGQSGMINEVSLNRRTEVRQALSAKTAARMRDILERVVCNGTGKLAAIEGVSVCGKTGTAQKVDPDGGYSSTRSLMSFVGFFPKERPRYLIAVMLDEPTRYRFAGSTACPVFREIGERLLSLDEVRAQEQELATVKCRVMGK
ncbi:MAG: peptidoglycan D,D-transpeptidase FtsI family protein [candidate division WOR-3 bacterium]